MGDARYCCCCLILMVMVMAVQCLCGRLRVGEQWVQRLVGEVVVLSLLLW